MDATACLEVAQPGYATCDARVVGAVASLRTGTFPTDLSGVAARLNAEVRYRAMPTSLWGATLPSGRVIVNANLTARRQRFALGHELGHVVASRHGRVCLSPADEEMFADRFARELLAPAKLIGDIGTAHVTAACDAFDVEDRLVLSQLALLGLVATGHLSDDGAVICQRCGDLDRDPGCPCGRMRYRNAVRSA